MGTLFSSGESKSPFAHFKGNIIYSADRESVLGRYQSPYVFDVNDNIVAVLADDAVYYTDKNGQKLRILHIAENNIMYGERKIAKYQGDLEGACAAAFLYFQEKLTGEKKPDNPLIAEPKFDNPEPGEEIYTLSLADLWKEFVEKCPGLLKAIIAIALLSSIYPLCQFPVTVSVLWESYDFGVAFLIIWIGAFLFGTVKHWNVCIESFSQFLRLLWKLLIPYLHALWMGIGYICIYAMDGGYFTASFFSQLLTISPALLLYMAAPLYLVQLVRVLYEIHKQTKGVY